MSSILITGGRVVDPSLGLDELRDLRISDGIVIEFGVSLTPAAGETVIDACNAMVVPGLIDMHVHLRDPGFPEKETLETGTEAAVRGGFTSVACMPNTDPPLDAPDALRVLRERADEVARCRVYPIAAMTAGRKGASLLDYDALVRAGAVGFSDDGDTVADASLLLAAARAARSLAQVFISHAEDPSFSAAAGKPAIAEDLIVARDLLIARESQKNWHVAHISTAGALELVRCARAAGVRVTCEATPHHLTFTNDGSNEDELRVNPPLRAQGDRDALRRGVFDGTVDVLASDHAPHTLAEKRGERGAVPPGFTGLEIALGAYAAALEALPISRLIELLSCNPARILGIGGGTLALGSAGDVTVFARRDWVVDPGAFASKGKATPFAGRRLPYQVLATIVGGVPRYMVPAQ